MANRLVDNVIIIDSGMGNLPAVGGASNNLTNYEVTGIAFLYVNTTSICRISGTNTSDAIARFELLSVNTGNAGLTFISALQSLSFAKPLRLSDLKCPTVTAGTAWVYLA